MDAIERLEESHAILGASEWLIRGDAPKDLVVCPTKGAWSKAYIAKAPRREGPRECVTEYAISLIGKRLPLRVAEGRLVVLGSREGRPDLRFMSRYFINRARGEMLVHGMELVARCFEATVDDISKEVRPNVEWKFYTIDLIDDVLRTVASDRAEYIHMRDALTRMLAFDALVGANDRHQENWGIIENVLQKDEPRRFAPIFDTARGLFWNHRDATLLGADARDDREGFIQRYASRSEPLIGFGAEQRPNHFALIEYMVKRDRGDRYAGPIRQIIEAFDPDECTDLLHEEFGRILSSTRLKYVDALLRFRHNRLRAICGS